MCKKPYAKKQLGLLMPLLAEIEHAKDEATSLGDQCPSWMNSKVEKVANQMKSAISILNGAITSTAAKPVPMTKEIQQKTLDELVKAGNNIVGAVSSAVENHAKNA